MSESSVNSAQPVPSGGSSSALNKSAIRRQLRESLAAMSEVDRHAKSIAGSRIRRENQDRFDDAMRNLRMGKLSQVEIDALPDAWKRYAENQGHLHLLRDGSYIARPSSIWATDEVLAEAREQLAKAREDGLL